ncbi:unnamed protein product [Hyaloperonospora brassicae]|uniref:RNAse P Rpr2/Rpp21 subunit domain-containing protein n=1 Tax=Hyaloperonospora brassicae TaxID=162125 RepID=A0AAV0TE42_HYABA|nr:unnamed protein product [Hyaloperonospora brassicae]
MASLPPTSPTIGALVLPEMNVASAENSRQLEKRFAFLWTSAHRLLPSNVTLANHLIASMMQMARTSRAQLPQSVLDFICARCGGLVVPSVSAAVRVVPQGRQSPANRRLRRQHQRSKKQMHNSDHKGPRLVRERLSTIVRVTCHRCRHRNDRPGTSVVYKAKLKKRREEGQPSAAHAPELQKRTTNDSVAGQVDDCSANVAGTSTTDVELTFAPSSMFAAVAPPGSPRKLLDGPKKRKKKKKIAQPDAAVVAVKNDLSSFLQGLASRK